MKILIFILGLILGGFLMTVFIAVFAVNHAKKKETKDKELESTVELMLSDDYKDRFRAEYKQ